MSHRITIDKRPRKMGERDPVFTVYHGGKELLRSSEPFFDACRALQAKGLTGTLEMYGPGLRMTGTIEKCAKFTIEGANLKLRKYRDINFGGNNALQEKD